MPSKPDIRPVAAHASVADARRSLGVESERAAEEGLRGASDGARDEPRWRENAEAITSSNTWAEKNLLSLVICRPVNRCHIPCDYTVFS